ncbi:hypothetical protein [Ruminococcus sp.]|uniref:hypothetical protein n=1 Tax=Ruminococcus sp. TaxID=41978 RepID=UPI00386A2C30
MKTKLSWIPFVPLFLAACFLKLAQGFMPDGSILGLSALQLEYCYIGACVLIFLFALLFVLLDKKIAQYYLPHKNIPAGLVGILLCLLLAADGGFTVFQVFSSGRISVLELLGAVLSLLSAVVFIILGLNHSFRYKEGKNLSLVNVIPAILCGVRMILSFVQFTTISIRLADVSSLICYVFATLFFFNYAVVQSLIKSKNALKNCFIFGLPAIAALIPYGIYHLVFRFDSEFIIKNAQPLEMLLFGLYILFVLIEITRNVLSKEEVTLIEEEEAPVVNVAEEKVEGFIATNDSEDENDIAEDTAYLEKSDTSDYLYRDTQQVNEDPEVNDETHNDVENYLTEVQDVSDENDDRPKNYEERLDEIDKLILDISSKTD